MRPTEFEFYGKPQDDHDLFKTDLPLAALLSDKHVLTAAHCQPGFLASLMVELGEYDITGECTQCEKLWKIHTVKHKPIYSIVSRKF